jgi:hypothetical protein
MNYNHLIRFKDCMSLWTELELAFLCRASRTGDFLVCPFFLFA